MDEPLKAARAILEQLKIALPPGEPTVAALLAAVTEGEQRLVEATARVPAVFAQLDADISSRPAPPPKKVAPLRVRGRKKPKAA